MTKPTSVWQHIKKALTPPASPTDHRSVLFDKTKANATGQEAIDEVRAIKAAKLDTRMEGTVTAYLAGTRIHFDRNIMQAENYPGLPDDESTEWTTSFPSIEMTWEGTAYRERANAWLDAQSTDALESWLAELRNEGSPHADDLDHALMQLAQANDRIKDVAAKCGGAV